jgi:hypothetical protein
MNNNTFVYPETHVLSKGEKILAVKSVSLLRQQQSKKQYKLMS